MSKSDTGLALVSEVASALEAHGAIPCRLSVDEDDGEWTLTLTFVADNVCASLGILELTSELRRVRDIAQMRGFAETYGIDPAKLEALILDGPAPNCCDHCGLPYSEPNNRCAGHGTDAPS